MLDDLLRTESDRVEWKQSPNDSDGILRATCALANDLGDSRQPGYVLIGVAKDGAIVGVGEEAKLDEVQRRLTDQLRSVKLVPTPALDVRHERRGDRFLVVITVQPYPVPPAVTVDAVVWVRQGTTTRRATEADLQRLQERRPENRRSFDQRPIKDATIDDLDRSVLVPEYEAARIGIEAPEIFPSFEAWLTQRQLGNLVAGTWRPNPTALLVFGLDPQAHFPGATVEFVHYGGIDVDSPVASRKTIAGTLPIQIDTLWTQIEAHIASTATDVSGAVEAYRPEYPLAALKELARNQVQHRQYEGTNAPSRVEWYVDRVEFSNPGGRFGRASEGEFGEHSDYRNPTITSALVALGYVQQLGRGIRLARLHLDRNGNPPLRVETDGFTRIVVEARR